MQETCGPNADTSYLFNKTSFKVLSVSTVENLSLDKSRQSNPLCQSKNVTDSIREIALTSAMTRATMFLERVRSESVVMHDDTTSSCVQHRVNSTSDKHGYVVVDVGAIIERWSSLTSTMSDFKFNSRVGFTNDDTLASLMLMLDMNLYCESSTELESLNRAFLMKYDDDLITNDMLKQSFSQSSVDICLTRSPSSLASSLKSGITTYFIDNVGDYKMFINKVSNLNIDSHLNYVISLSSKLFGNNSDSTESLKLGSFVDVKGCCDQHAVELLINNAPNNSSVTGFSVTAADMMITENIDVLVNLFNMLHPTSDGMFCLHVMSLDSETATSSQLLSNIEYLNCYISNVIIHYDVAAHLIGDSHELIANVIGTRPTVDRITGAEVGQQVFVDDGIYGCLCNSNTGVTGNAALSIGNEVDPLLIRKSDSVIIDETTLTTIWGQTCDSLDKIAVCDKLPKDIKRGDWIKFPACRGASTSTKFNGYGATETKYFIRYSTDVSVGLFRHDSCNSLSSSLSTGSISSLSSVSSGNVSPPIVSKPINPRRKNHPHFMHACVTKDRSIVTTSIPTPNCQGIKKSPITYGRSTSPVQSTPRFAVKNYSMSTADQLMIMFSTVLFNSYSAGTDLETEVMHDVSMIRPEPIFV